MLRIAILGGILGFIALPIHGQDTLPAELPTQEAKIPVLIKIGDIDAIRAENETLHKKVDELQQKLGNLTNLLDQANIDKINLNVALAQEVAKEKKAADESYSKAQVDLQKDILSKRIDHIEDTLVRENDALKRKIEDLTRPPSSAPFDLKKNGWSITSQTTTTAPPTPVPKKP